MVCHFGPDWNISEFIGWHSRSQDDESYRLWWYFDFLLMHHQQHQEQQEQLFYFYCRAKLSGGLLWNLVNTFRPPSGWILITSQYFGLWQNTCKANEYLINLCCTLSLELISECYSMVNIIFTSSLWLVHLLTIYFS